MVKLTPLSTFFVNFANKICQMHCTWVYNNEFFIIKWSHVIHVTNFVSKIDKKMYLEGLISPIKKPQVVILQNQNPMGSVCN